MNARELLAQTDRHIAECKARIARVREIIQTGDLEGAEELLRAFEASLLMFEKHREQIVDWLKNTERHE